MASFQSGQSPSYDQVEETATYLLARDEDCENSFHSTADFVRQRVVMLSLHVLVLALM